MSAGRKYLPKPNPKRPIRRGEGFIEIRPDHCVKCGTQLDPARYHDCGEQQQLPLGE